MHKYLKLSLGVALGLGVTGCGDFITEASSNPNSATEATMEQLFVASQARQFVIQEGQLARFSAIFTQQLIGSNNQQRNWGTSYLFTENDLSTYLQQFYVGGGLLDLRKIQAMAQEVGDQKFEGVAKIMEAFSMGMAASIFGDIPYREAVSDIPTPKLDPQEQVYQDVLALLDEGIALLDGAGAGPGNHDLVYKGDMTRWKKAANTMKARFHLHLAERYGEPAYQAALAAAQQGIDERPTSVEEAVHGQGPGDFRTFHGNTISDGNLWAQFLGARQDIIAGHALVSILSNRPGDPRLAGYFDEVPDGGYRGADQNLNIIGGGTAASVVDTETRRKYDFRQPVLTWAENELILAEAKFQTGDAPGALTHVNNVRQAVGLADLPGPITLEEIMTEKYIVQFQNIDVWSDYRRTCYPQITPHGSHAEVPGRLFYGAAERRNNPNIPLPSDQPTRNWNDPNPCPRP